MYTSNGTERIQVIAIFNFVSTESFLEKLINETTESQPFKFPSHLSRYEFV